MKINISKSHVLYKSRIKKEHIKSFSRDDLFE